jgi:methylenetetrahydrofolate reductase (NADPH)
MKTFKQSLQADSFVITAELLVRDGDGPKEILQQAETIQESVAAIHVMENPFQPDQISSLAAATILVRNGIDTIPELNSRDRNRIALMSDLLGLRALGIGSIMMSEGNEGPQQPGNPEPPAQDVNCLELISIAQSFNEDESTSPDEELLIGVQTQIDPPQSDAILSYLAAGAAAGARFLQIKPCFDMKLLRDFMQRLVEAQLTWNYAVTIGLASLPSATMARRFLEQRPGCVIPASVLGRLESSRDPRREGIAICSELIREVKTIPGVAGVKLITMDSPQDVVHIIRESNS